MGALAPIGAALASNASWLVPTAAAVGTGALQYSQQRGAAKEADVAREDAQRIASASYQRELDAYNENKSALQTAKDEAARQIEASYANAAAGNASAADEATRALLARRNVDETSPLGRAIKTSNTRTKNESLAGLTSGRSSALANNTANFANSLSSLRPPSGASLAQLYGETTPYADDGLGELTGRAAQLAGYYYNQSSKKKKASSSNAFYDLEQGLANGAWN